MEPVTSNEKIGAAVAALAALTIEDIEQRLLELYEAEGVLRTVLKAKKASERAKNLRKKP